MYFAPQASVKAVDVHGNSERVVERDSGLYARLAEWVPKLPGTLRLLKQAFAVSLTPLEAVGLLAGFSYAVGQSVNDIITLLRNPDQLLAFVDLAKAIYERPTILPTLIEAFVGTFQRFQNVQNPFPGPQNLLNPTNPSTFTTDNSTFGRTWFGGYALAFVTLGIATGGASAAALTALEGFSATLANTIRFVISAPSLLASRAAGLVGRTALRVAVRVGQATELRVSAVKRTVSGLPTPRLQRVSASIRRLDDDLEEAITAGCGGGFTLADGDCFDEELAEFVEETARENGPTLLNELPTERAAQLIRTDLDVGETMVKAWNRDPGIDTDDVAAVSRRLDDADGLIKTRLEQAVAEGGANGVKLVAELDDLAPLTRFIGGTDDEAGTTLIGQFDDRETLEQFFELDVSNPDEVRLQQARFFDEDLYSASRVEQFTEDVQALEGNDIDGFDDGEGSIITQVKNTGEAFKMRGIQYQLRGAATLDVEDIEAIDRLVKEPDGTHITDLDVETENILVEARNTLREEDAIDKLERFVRAHEVGEVDLDGKRIVFMSTNKLDADARNAIRAKARTIEDTEGNGIDDIEIDFEQEPPVDD